MSALRSPLGAATCVLLLACGGGAPEKRASGDVVVVSAEELQELLHDVPEELDSLVFGGPDFDAEELVVAGLREVRGELSVSLMPRVKRVSFPDLERVDGVFAIAYNDALRELEVPKLAYAGAIVIDENTKLAALSLPMLASTGSLAVHDNRTLRTLTADRLATLESEIFGAGRINVAHNGALEELSFPAVRELYDLDVEANSALRSIELTALRTLLYGTSITYNERLERLTLPELESAVSVFVYGTSVQTIAVPALKSADQLAFSCPLLRSLELPALEEVSELGFLDTPLRQLAAPRLTAMTIANLPRESLEQLSLPKLEEGCSSLMFMGLADCALDVVAPLCREQGLVGTEGCSCSADGDLQKVRCPKQ